MRWWRSLWRYAFSASRTRTYGKYGNAIWHEAWKTGDSACGSPRNQRIDVIGAQDGGDHVDAHRSTASIVGPYVKQNAVVSTPYNTVNMVRTIEEILGLDPLNLNDAIALPMTEVFDVGQSRWKYTAAPSSLLYNTTLPLPARSADLRVPRPKHNAAYWARVTKGMDFSKEDLVDPVSFNRVLWQGLKGDRIYPSDASLAQTHALYKKALKNSVASRVDRDGD